MGTRPKNVAKRGTFEGKMAAELDPLFVKAITLLNSRHPDSARQLKTLIQDYRDKVTGETRREKVSFDALFNQNNSRKRHVNKTLVLYTCGDSRTPIDLSQKSS